MVFGMPGSIILKSKREIEKMSEAGKILAGAYGLLREMISPGLETRVIDEEISKFVIKRGGVCTFNGYRGFPHNTCISINEEVVHGFPSKRKLKEGEIVSVDLGVTLDGYIADSALTLPVGSVSDKAKRLLRVTRECLYRAIEASVSGNYIRDISESVESHATEHGYSVVRKFVGHGIGRDMHEKPEVPNFVSVGKGAKISPGLVLAIEPMVNIGTHDVFVEQNGWTVKTADGELSAHFEHTVAVTADGPLVLTRRDNEEEEDF